MKERINTNPHIIHFTLKRNRYFPNSRLPVLIYKGALELPAQKNKSALIVQKIFLQNDWSNTWRNGIYDFHHYHSITHECMGIACGSATVIFGGPNGKRIKLKTGDVLILPAGVAHKCSHATKDFLCVGSYPQGKEYDIKTGTAAEYKASITHIHKLAVPRHDPLAGKEGFLKVYWK